jgi:hypothetical protein
MAEKKRERQKTKGTKAATGTLIRGADGALYFVDDGKTWAVRLKEEFSADAQALLDKEHFFADKERLPAFHASQLVSRSEFDDIRVNLQRLAALGRRKPPAK